MVMDCSEGSPPQQLCKSLALIALLLGIVFSFIITLSDDYNTSREVTSIFFQMVRKYI